MAGAGTFEVGIGLPFAALNLYFVFRDRVSPLVLVLLGVALAPILGVVIAAALAYLCMRFWLSKRKPRAMRAPADALRR